MADERDRLGEKLREVEKAREDQWAHEEDRKLMEKMRHKMAQQKQAGAALRCPQCGKPLTAKAFNGVAMMACPENHGAWLDPSSLETALKVAK
jgi:peptide deformylase